MCKIFVMTNVSKLTNKQIESIVNVVHGKMSSEKHGFGFLYSTKNGFFGRKFTNPNDFKVNPSSFGPLARQFLSMGQEETLGFLDSAPLGGLIVHGRTSTNDHTLVNTHPLTNEDFALIHNGIVENVGKEIKRKSTNDTEFILEHYFQGGIKQVSESIEGYYACAAINLKNKNTIIFRDSTARLFFAWSESLKSYIFATTEEIIKAVLKTLKLKAEISECAKNFHAIFDVNGKEIEFSNFMPRERSFGVIDRSSLGYSPKYSNYDYIVAESNLYDIAEYEYKDQWGRDISEDRYEAMDVWEREYCSVYSKGNKVS